MESDSTGEEIINKLPKIGGIKDSTKRATDLPIGLRDLQARKTQTPRIAIKAIKVIDRAILIVQYLNNYTTILR